MRGGTMSILNNIAPIVLGYQSFKPIILELEKRIVDLESQLSIALEIMTDKQIAENQHLFQQHIDIEDSLRKEYPDRRE